MTRATRMLALCITAAAPLAAQTGSRLRFEVEASGAAVTSMPEIGSVGSSLSGTVFGGEGWVGLGPVSLNLGYWQGKLSNQSGPASDEDIVEGKALLGIAPVRWFTISGGPYARAYTTPAGTERWLSWRVQGRVDQDIVPNTVQAYAEVWFIASSSVNVVQPFSSGRGGNVGLKLAPQRWPVWLQLGYGIEQIRLGDGSRLDTVDRVSFGVGYSRR